MSTERAKVIVEPHALPQGRDHVSPGATEDLVRRIVDIALSATLLLVASPLMLLIAIALWFESPGPVIFTQQRLGRHGKSFTFYKFRKFPVSWGRRGPAVTVANDVRLTRIGAILERTKLNELPQLWNILKGDMTFVGLRPEMSEFSELFSGRYKALLDHLPGLFGPGVDRNECDLYPPDEDPEVYYQRVLFPSKADRFLAYYENAGLLSDLLWIGRGAWDTIAGTVSWKHLLRSRGTIMAIDAALIVLGWTLVNFFRFRGVPEEGNFSSFLAGLWIFPLFFVICALVGHCYRYPLRHFSLADGIRLVLSFSVAWMAGFLVVVALTRHVSLYLIPMGWFVLVTLLMLGRISFRFGPRIGHTPPAQAAPRILIYGSGDGGMALANWIKASSTMSGGLLGYLDDNRAQRGNRVGGVKILGGERDLPSIQSVHEADEIWVTFAPDHRKRHRLSNFCAEHGINLVVIPDLEPFSRLVLTPPAGGHPE